MSQERKGTTLSAFQATTPNSSSSVASAWSQIFDTNKLKKPAPQPPPKPSVFTETRRGTQTREFTTRAGSSLRSVSTSRRKEQRTNTIAPDASTYTPGPWVHIEDTNRSHTHPGGAPHTPTAAPGSVPGLTSTPIQRVQLNNMQSTVSTRIVWD